ncbi:MAG: hypothetical protein ACK4MX_04125 [Thermaurantiacus sp.]
MTARLLFGGERLEVGCTVIIDHSPEHFGAHVLLDGEPEIGPGDRVRVTGEPIEVQPGDHLVLRRTAHITRATPFERAWTRLTGHFEMLELADVSFTDRRLA